MTWVDAITKLLAVVGLFVGGAWGLKQHLTSTRLKAAELLLSMEEEFRRISPIFVELEDLEAYGRLIKPVLDAERLDALDDDSVCKLCEIDRCLRFLYLCSVLNDALHADHVFGVEGGALSRAYYHYIAILLEEQRHVRPELLDYTVANYPKLTAWVASNASQLRRASESARASLTTGEASLGDRE